MPEDRSKCLSQGNCRLGKGLIITAKRTRADIGCSVSVCSSSLL